MLLLQMLPGLEQLLASLLLLQSLLVITIQVF